MIKGGPFADTAAGGKWQRKRPPVRRGRGDVLSVVCGSGGGMSAQARMLRRPFVAAVK